MSSPSTPPRDMIAKFLKALIPAGSVFEVRAPKCLERKGANYASTVSGYYESTQIDKAAADITDLDATGRAPAIYVTLNPVRGDLLARSPNALKAKAAETTADTDIHCRRWLLVDCDPARPSGLSASESELAAARDRARQIWKHLKERGWPEPVAVMSGNGCHLLYRIDLPAADGDLVQRVLTAVAQRFDDDAVKVDRGVFNAARVTKVAGTMARKGADFRGTETIEARPHRRAALLHVPEAPQPVPIELLAALADEAVVTPPSQAAAAARPRADSGDGARFARFEHTPAGVRGYLEQHGVGVKGEGRDGDSTLLFLERCPVVADCESTGNSDIAVIVGAEGRLAYRNLHNRGTGLTWLDVREALEPGYKAHAQAARTAGPTHAKGGASGGSVSSPLAAPPKNWPDPQPLPEGLPPVAAFDPALLPEAFRPWIVDIADRIQCPIDFPSVAAMLVAASLIGRQIGIRPKRKDDWTVVPNLWGGVVGRPGVMKTPAIQEALKPLNRLEIEAKRKFEAECRNALAGKLVADAQKKDAERKIKKLLSNPEEALRVARESIEEDDGDEPVRSRFIVNDSSVEKLGVILNENPSGVLVFRDELVGLLKALDKPGQECARAFYLEAWNGTGRFSFDRIGRGTLDIEATTVSILGGVQPGPLAGYLREAAEAGIGDDGLLQRYQLMVWPDVSKDWVNVDRWPNREAREKAWAVFEALSKLEPDLLGVDRDPYDPAGIPFLRFDDAAQRVFDEWRAGLERLVRSGDLHPVLESHLAKYRSLVPSLALVIHLVDGHRGPVGLSAVQRAIGWARYLETHARRIYSPAINPEVSAVLALAKRILAGDIKEVFSLRDVYRKGWTDLGSKEAATAGVAYLIELDWVASVVRTTNGRSAVEYYVNPKAHAMGLSNRDARPEGTDTTDRSNVEDPSVSSGGSPPGQSESREPGEEDAEWTA